VKINKKHKKHRIDKKETINKKIKLKINKKNLKNKSSLLIINNNRKYKTINN
jgi:hypothetical protein